MHYAPKHAKKHTPTFKMPPEKTRGERWSEEVANEPLLHTLLVGLVMMIAVCAIVVVVGGSQGPQQAHAETLQVASVKDASVKTINGKMAFNQWKSKKAKAALKSYSKWSPNMTKAQRKAYLKLVSKSLDQKTKEGVTAKLDKLKPYLKRVKLCQHIDARGYSNRKVNEVCEWGKRLDRYLSGTPMAGTGYIIAETAYDHGMDPRLYPAIAEVESGRGVAPYGSCYNVCGWVWNPPYMADWKDACVKWHSFFKSYFGSERYPISSMHGYGGYGPSYVNEQMARI